MCDKKIQGPLKKYDYIFIGAGCAALSLLTRMINAGLLTGKQVLLIDREPKEKNDRTWCFWENKPGFFEPVVCKEWDRIRFYSTTYSGRFNILPYRYKMIRGIDFYRYCNKILQQQLNIDTLYAEITAPVVRNGQLQLCINGQETFFSGAVVFNSTWKAATVKQQPGVHLLQHFKGWMIETNRPFFDPAEAVLMDFRTPQLHGTSFLYVLPLANNRALVEYTLFSENILADARYEEGLQQYIRDFLQLPDYSILEKEFGVIPMTSAQFPWYADGMYHIGTAGGQTKASSGYTFQFIQQQSHAIIDQIRNNCFGPHLRPAATAKRFRWYDAVLLRVLTGHDLTGSELFTRLFKKNNTADIFRFLDNQSSFATDLRIISSLPAWPFLKAAYRQLTGR